MERHDILGSLLVSFSTHCDTIFSSKCKPTALSNKGFYDLLMHLTYSNNTHKLITFKVDVETIH